MLPSSAPIRGVPIHGTCAVLPWQASRRGEMDILYTLIPLSILLVFAILVALAWAAHSGQV